MALNRERLNKRFDEVCDYFEGLGFWEILDLARTEREGFFWEFRNNYRDELINEGYELHAGATRFIIIDELENVVFKIQYDDNGYEIDYNRNETSMYNAAVEEGVGYAFAEAVLLDRKVRFTHEYAPFGQIEAMELVDCDCAYVSDELYTRLAKSRAEDAGVDINDRDAFDTYLDSIFYYEGDTTDVVECLCDEYSCEVGDFIESKGINDIHEGNVGINGGKLVVVDYAGFNVRLVA